MVCHIVADNRGNADLLFQILKPEFIQGIPSPTVNPRTFGRLRLDYSTSRSGAVATARTILATRRQPVALVLDAETNFEDRIVEQRESLNESLRAVSPGVPWRTILAVPQMEVCLFLDQKFVEELFKTRLDQPELMLNDARYRPRYWVHMLLADSGQSTAEWIESHEKRDELLARIRETNLISEIREFIEQTIPSAV